MKSERENSSNTKASYLVDAAAYTACFEGALLAMAASGDDANRPLASGGGSGDNIDPITEIVALSTVIDLGKIAAFAYVEQLRPWILGYEAVVFSAMLYMRAKYGPIITK